MIDLMMWEFLINVPSRIKVKVLIESDCSKAGLKRWIVLLSLAARIRLSKGFTESLKKECLF